MAAVWDERFEALLREKLPDLPPGEPLAADAPMQHLGLTSLNMVALLSTLEMEYDIMVPDDQLVLETFATPENLWRVVTASMTTP